MSLLNDYLKSAKRGRGLITRLASIDDTPPHWPRHDNPQRSVIPETMLRWSRWRELTHPERNPHND